MSLVFTYNVCSSIGGYSADIRVQTTDGLLLKNKRSVQTTDGLLGKNKRSVQTTDGLIGKNKRPVQTTDGLLVKNKRSIQTTDGILGKNKRSVQTRWTSWKEQEINTDHVWNILYDAHVLKIESGDT